PAHVELVHEPRAQPAARWGSARRERRARADRDHRRPLIAPQRARPKALWGAHCALCRNGGGAGPQSLQPTKETRHRAALPLVDRAPSPRDGIGAVGAERRRFWTLEGGPIVALPQWGAGLEKLEKPLQPTSAECAALVRDAEAAADLGLDAVAAVDE